MCERLSPWVLQKEIRTVMADREGIENLLSPVWREGENKNAVLWWNLVLSFMRYRFPFTFLLQGSFEQNLNCSYAGARAKASYFEYRDPFIVLFYKDA
jgi:hypothetical protein